MNLMLMRYGYPIAIITRDDRQRYYDTLETSQVGDLTPLMVLIKESVEESLEEYERAVAEHVADLEWAQSLASRFTQAQRTEAENEYEIWKHAMELFRGYMRQTANAIDVQAREQAGRMARIFFEDFGMIDFEKYVTLRGGQSAKRTWFFRVDFRAGDRAQRFLFFFGFPNREMGATLMNADKVTLHIATEVTPFFFERLDLIKRSNYPDLVEVGYDSPAEKFVARYIDGTITRCSVEIMGRQFFDQVIKRHYSA